MKKHKQKNLSPRKKKIQEARRLESFYRKQLDRAENLIWVIDRLLQYDGNPIFQKDGTIVLEHEDSIEYIEIPRRDCRYMTRESATKKELRERKELLQRIKSTAEAKLARTIELRRDLQTKPKGELTAYLD